MAGSNWSDEETLKLIEIWSEDGIQAQLEGCKRNKVIYDKIARQMTVAGFERTAEQCRDKVKKLKGEYRKIKDKHGKTGEGRKRWKFLEAMDTVLGNKPATKPPVVIDTLGDGGTSNEDTNEVHLGDGTCSVESRESSPMPETPGPSKSATPCPGDNSDSSTSGGIKGHSADLPRGGGDTKKKFPKKRSREERLQTAIGSMMDTVLKAQAKSDQMFLELEEKRMRFEEKEREREERVRAQEREFQARMFSLMMGASGTQPHPMGYSGEPSFFPHSYDEDHY